MTLRVATLALVLGALVMMPGRLAAQNGAEPAGPDTVVFTPKRGPVTFTHRKHAELAGECVSCHHESKPEKPLTAKNEKCSSCHTTPATEPMKTTLRLAFHDTVKKEGVCYTCHKTEAAAGKPAPTACADCHQSK